jgi:hypothetical protein
MFKRRSSQPAQIEETMAEDAPLLKDMRQAIARMVKSASHSIPEPVTEASQDVEPLCATLEAVLAHGFKKRQFYLFSVSPASSCVLASSPAPHPTYHTPSVHAHAPMYPSVPWDL